LANEAEILIVEDDEVIMGTLAYNLSRNGFGVSQATTGAEALRMARKLRPDLILLDIMLPEESGIEVCERIRERDQGVMIVMITAKDAEEDKVRGFEAGADDYVTKPFGMKELVARINANLKRGETGGRGKLIEAGDLQLDTKNFTARAGEEPLDLRAAGGARLHAGGAQEPRGARERGLGARGRRFLPHHRRAYKAHPGRAGGEELLRFHPHGAGLRLPVRGQAQGRRRATGVAVGA
jgi:CheY-like chemotaxis protein